jgi:uncharacterized glyoxalase superfamily protein PhnB
METTQQYPNSVHLTVSDVKKSIKFYTEKLGFELKEVYPSPKKPEWASMMLDQQIVMLGAVCTPDAAKEAGASKDEIDLVKKDAKAFAKGNHGVGVAIYICVDDVDRHYKHAKKKRADIVTKPKTQFYGIRDFALADPDGYRLVMYRRVAQEMPMPAAAPAATADDSAAIEA